MAKIRIKANIGKKDTLPKNTDNPTSLELPAKPDGSMYQEGEVADMKAADAQKFIACGLGEDISGAPKTP